jgi:alpha-L-rhamnosidase
LGVRVAEGWFSGRIRFEGGRRNIWGSNATLLAQLEITFEDGHSQKICSDNSWQVARGSIRLAEIYDGEKYDVTLEISDWSSPVATDALQGTHWEAVVSSSPLPDSVNLTAGYDGPVRRIETVSPVKRTISPSGRSILDFGQNVVDYLRLKHIKGPRGHKIILRDAEVLHDDELCTRPLRDCQAMDEYTLTGSRGDLTETYEPRFTFHEFRYTQID